MFKKILLSTFVLGTFAAYAIHLKTDDEEHVPVVMITPHPENLSGTFPENTSFHKGKYKPQLRYKDGSYTGNVADAFYGPFQVKAVINGGQITDVQFLQYPNDRRTSVEINQQAMPYLKQEAIAAQSSQVDGVSGATQTSRAFIETLDSALKQAT